MSECDCVGWTIKGALALWGAVVSWGRKNPKIM
jgi:hypothetical protein